MTKEERKHFEETKECIIRTPRGTHYHNVVQYALTNLAQKTSNKIANLLIDDLELDFNKAKERNSDN